VFKPRICLLTLEFAFHCGGNKFIMGVVTSRSLVSVLSSFGREAGRMVLPSPCVVCGEELPWKSRTASCCQTCWLTLPRITHAKCLRCAMAWASDEKVSSFVCARCHQDPGCIEWVDAWGHYRGSLEKVIHAFKFSRHDFLGAPLGRLMADLLVARGCEDLDVIVPVPIHRRRLRARGYNQSAILADAISTVLRIHRKDLLTKGRDNAVQSQLPRSERAQNVDSVFQASSDVASQSVLLVDDISTTGETLQACGRALLEAGARRVCAVILARA